MGLGLYIRAASAAYPSESASSVYHEVCKSWRGHYILQTCELTTASYLDRKKLKLKTHEV